MSVACCASVHSSGLPLWIRRTEDGSGTGTGIEPVTAPQPLFGVFDQSSADRIEMHVVEFFVLLPKTPHVEIIEAALPETRMAQQRFVIE